MTFRRAGRAQRQFLRMLSERTVHRHHVYDTHSATNALLRVQPDHSVCPHLHADASDIPAATWRGRKDRTRLVTSFSFRTAQPSDCRARNPAILGSNPTGVSKPFALLLLLLPLIVYGRNRKQFRKHVHYILVYICIL